MPRKAIFWGSNLTKEKLNYFSIFLYWLGVQPICFLKSLVKYPSSLMPTAFAASATQVIKFVLNTRKNVMTMY